MYCTHCGQQIDDQAVLCPHCGVPTGINPLLTPSAPTEPTTFTPAQTQAPEQAPARKMKPFNGFALAGFILGTASAAIGILAFSIIMLASIANVEEISALPSFALLFSLFGAICGLVFSAVGLGLRKRYARGMGFGIAGLIISIIHFVCMILLYLLAFMFLGFVLLFFAALASGGGF